MIEHIVRVAIISESRKSLLTLCVDRLPQDLLDGLKSFMENVAFRKT